jgi:hypothetical protein
VEQRVPGEVEEAEDSPEARGIPDGWIYNDLGWALLIESKAAAQVSLGQLRRHVRTAKRAGFKEPMLLVLTARTHKRRFGNHIIQKTWPELYEWLIARNNHSQWARTLVEYLAIAETRLAADEYLQEGALTVFSGIPFSKDNPYTYLEAKRLLKLAMDELRERRDLRKQIGMNPEGPGRGAITGTKGSAVWDFLPIKVPARTDTFTSAPHLTFSIRQKSLWTALTIPNNIRRHWRRNLQDLDEEQFWELFAQINRNLRKALRGANGAVPWVEMVQRHFMSQRSTGIVDAKLEFDLRTAFGGDGRVREQLGWLSATHRVFKRPRANIQLMVGAVFPFDSCKKVRSSQILDQVAGTWIACKPLLDTVMNGR